PYAALAALLTRDEILHRSSLLFSDLHPQLSSTLFPYTTLFRSLWLNDAVEPVSLAQSTVSTNGLGVVIGADRMTTPSPFVETVRSEEHTSELQSRFDLVCRLLLEKKKKFAFNASTVNRFDITLL